MTVTWTPHQLFIQISSVFAIICGNLPFTVHWICLLECPTSITQTKEIPLSLPLETNQTGHQVKLSIHKGIALTRNTCMRQPLAHPPKKSLENPSNNKFSEFSKRQILLTITGGGHAIKKKSTQNLSANKQQSKQTFHLKSGAFS